METKEVKELITGIGYANGVALSQSGDFVLVVETARNRILKYSLLGPFSFIKFLFFILKYF